MFRSGSRVDATFCVEGYRQGQIGDSAVARDRFRFSYVDMSRRRCVGLERTMDWSFVVRYRLARGRAKRKLRRSVERARERARVISSPGAGIEMRVALDCGGNGHPTAPHRDPR